MSEEIGMKRGLKGLIQDSAPDTGIEGKINSSSSPKELEIFYGHISGLSGKRQISLAAQYDNRAAELWRRDMDVPAEAGVLKTKARLESAIQGIGGYHFTSELTRQALLGPAWAKLEKIAKTDTVQLANALNVPETMKDIPEYDPLVCLKSFYDFVRQQENKEDKKELSKIYDDKATELWWKKINAVDIKNRGSLQELDKAINNFPFFHKQTPDALLDYLLQRKRAGNG